MQRRAAIRLVLCTAAWGLSFPTAKAVMEAQGVLMPGRPEWFHAAFILMNRMLIAVVVMLVLLRGRRKGFTWLEVRQGLELGLFGGMGMLLGLFLAALALPGLALGYGLFARRSWARPSLARPSSARPWRRRARPWAADSWGRPSALASATPPCT